MPADGAGCPGTLGRQAAQLGPSCCPQDAAFFDTTKTGEVTSRLSADTTTVSDSTCLNLNVLLRSATQAAIVLAFMFSASWRLTVVTFVMIPLVLAICKVQGCPAPGGGAALAAAVAEPAPARAPPPPRPSRCTARTIAA
jgi:hypothetical protein